MTKIQTTVGVCRIDRTGRGAYDVLLRFPRPAQDGSKKIWLRGIHANIVECALGREDVDYLCETDSDESGCFRITRSELADFVKYREVAK